MKSYQALDHLKNLLKLPYINPSRYAEIFKETVRTPQTSEEVEIYDAVCDMLFFTAFENNHHEIAIYLTRMSISAKLSEHDYDCIQNLL